MLILVQIDLSAVEMGLFESYETQVLALLGDHGGTLVERLRATDGGGEVHLIHFADAAGLDAFRADSRRAALQHLWSRSGASATVIEVRRLDRQAQ